MMDIRGILFVVGSAAILTACGPTEAEIAAEQQARFGLTCATIIEESGIAAADVRGVCDCVYGNLREQHAASEIPGLQPEVAFATIPGCAIRAGYDDR